MSRPSHVRKSLHALLTAATVALLPGSATPGQDRPAAEPERRGSVEMRSASASFVLRLDRGAITSLRRVGDLHDTDYIRAGSRFGDLILRWRGLDGRWEDASTLDIADAGPFRDSTEGSGGPYRAEWSLGRGGPRILTRHAFEGESLVWTVELRNEGAEPIEIGDLAFPCPMNSDYTWDSETTYHRRVIRHSFVAGDGSFIYWMRCDGTGPYLLLTPLPGSGIEYFDTAPRGGGPRSRGYTVFIHSAGQDDVLRARSSRWRLPRTGRRLEPAGRQGSSSTYGFRLSWAQDTDDVRRHLHDEGLFDVHVIPGMTVPDDLAARVAVRTKTRIASVEPEFPADTEVRDLGEREGAWRLLEVRFGRLGENLLSLRRDDGRCIRLEFFVTEPLETLVKKRARFIARCQHRDPARWYDGLITDWNMRDRVLPSPDDLDRIPEGRRYAVTCDDPGLCKPAFLAAKNAEFPDLWEIEALEYYADRFLWGGLQRTDRETYPHGVYGIQDWKRNRESADEGAKGKLHIWRIYDYPHVVMFWLHLYRIARCYPEIPMRRCAEDYLRRAHGTAMAFFTYPLEIEKWSAYETGTYDEVVIEDLLRFLEREGLRDEARTLRVHWNRKVEFFLSGRANLFGSEYPFDTTGFESTHAFARYALRGEGRSWNVGEGPRFDPEAARRFLGQQIALNVGSRGWIEAAYYLLGSDYRGSGNGHYTLSYMSQMGGWSILDYALHHSGDPWPLLRLGYASILSSWALVNSGPPETDCGYWYPGPENDGGAGGGFEPAPYGTTWLGQPHGRGSWYYACEIDLGFGGALRAAATVLVDDPLFGPFAYGGSFERTAGGWLVRCRDGVRRRFHAILQDLMIHLEVERDHFAADIPLELDDGASRIAFVLQSPSSTPHATPMELSGLLEGRYAITVDGARIGRLQLRAGEAIRVDLPVTRSGARVEIAREAR